MRGIRHYCKAQETIGQRRASLSFAWSLALSVAFILLPAAVEAASFGDLICNIKNNSLSAYPSAIAAVSYVVGAFMAVRSVLMFKAHGENPAQSKVVPATAHAVASGAFLSFPSFAGVIQRSLFGSAAGGGGDFACQASSIGGGSGTIGLDVMMQNFVKNIHGPIFTLLALTAAAVGLTMIYQGIMKGAKTGTDPRASNPKDIVVNLVIGAVLISIATVLPDTLQTIFGDATVSQMSSTTNIISWAKITGDAGGTENADKTVRAILAFVQIIGGISFLRGWLLMKKALEGGQATVPQGLTHIIAGAMAINIDKMLAILDKTFNTGIIAS